MCAKGGTRTVDLPPSPAETGSGPDGSAMAERVQLRGTASGCIRRAFDSCDSRPGDGPPRVGVESVEVALARALDRASAAERWDVVLVLARELEARRTLQPNSDNEPTFVTVDQQ